MTSGLLLLDKPLGLSSNRALQWVRRTFQIKKAGFIGTLDPLATGLLPIALNEATKFIQYQDEACKTYQACVYFGVQTTTGDTEGPALFVQRPKEGFLNDLKSVCSDFLGRQLQTPPMYSALKYQGKALYQLARQGKQIERKPREVIIHRLECLQAFGHSAIFEIECSKGTYIRTLCEDMAQAMGTVAHLRALRRVSVGNLSTQQHSMAKLEAFPEQLSNALLPMACLVEHLPAITLPTTDVQALRMGQTLPPVLTEKTRLYDEKGHFYGIAGPHPDGMKAYRLLSGKQ